VGRRNSKPRKYFQPQHRKRNPEATSPRVNSKKRGGREKNDEVWLNGAVNEELKEQVL